MKTNSHRIDPEEVVLAALTILGAIMLVIGIITMAGCASAPDVQVQRAWGTGGVELTVDGTPVYLEVEEAGIQFDDGELGSCTSVVASVAGAVAEGVVTEISDSRCVTEGGLLPFGLRRVLLVRVPESTGARSAE
jgi:hypothetical protein